MEKWQWLVDVFTFIGMAVCIIIALIAIIWITCFLVKLLVKTFGVKVGKSYDLMVEDINKKADARKERNEIKRQAKLSHKMEILNAKLESKQKIHDMKMSKLEGRLEIKEKNAMIKIFGDEISNFEIKTNVKAIKNDEDKKQEEENEEVFEKIAEVAEIVDGDVQTIEAINPEEDKKKSAKKTTKKTSKKK